MIYCKCAACQWLCSPWSPPSGTLCTTKPYVRGTCEQSDGVLGANPAHTATGPYLCRAEVLRTRGGSPQWATPRVTNHHNTHSERKRIEHQSSRILLFMFIFKGITNSSVSVIWVLWEGKQLKALLVIYLVYLVYFCCVHLIWGLLEHWSQF